MSAQTHPRSAEETLAEVARVLRIAPGRMAGDPKGALLADLVANMAAHGYEREGPIRDTFARIGDRWCMLLLLILRSGPFHYAALRRLVAVTSAEKAISQRMLTLRLRSLERNGFIVRAERGTRSRRVEYDLTPLGRELTARAFELIRWIGTRTGEIERARRRFDRLPPDSA